MKKSILNIGKALNKTEQRAINGGVNSQCSSLFLCQFFCEEGDSCAFPSQSGGILFGTIKNGVCCI